MFKRDVYMRKSFLAHCSVDDEVNFQIYAGDRGRPKVCWLERSEAPIGTLILGRDQKRPAPDLEDGALAKRPAVSNSSSQFVEI